MPSWIEQAGEPVKAYLRIRPHATTGKFSSSYFTVMSDKTVSLVPPEDSSAYRSRNGAAERYHFNTVFQETDQKQVFKETMAPLIQTFLNGSNALIFAYGVTNSGKTYTMLGRPDDPGLVYRTLGSLFTALQGRMSEAKVKPSMHSQVKVYEDPAEENATLIAQQDSEFAMGPPKMTAMSFDVIPNFEFGIWISFAEVYNEKVYDLLASDKDRGNPLRLTYEYRTGYKYIAGITQIKVKSLEDACKAVARGQKNRAAFATLLNHASSRSHSIFTVSLVRCPVTKGDFIVEDPAYTIVSRLSLVDLAGSERHRNTQSEGERLKEAGNINKSLMVLGLCMDVLRANQINLQAGRKPSVVPYNQSKLTELFREMFDGHGSASIIVNINPFDTGYEENCHVMRFAAIAKEVTTTQRELTPMDLDNLDDAAVRQTTTDSQRAKELQAEIENLKMQSQFLKDKWLQAEARCDLFDQLMYNHAVSKADSDRQVNICLGNLGSKISSYEDEVRHISDWEKYAYSEQESDVEEEYEDIASKKSMRTSRPNEKYRMQLNTAFENLENQIKLSQTPLVIPSTSTMPSHTASTTATPIDSSLGQTPIACTSGQHIQSSYNTFFHLRKQLRRYTDKQTTLNQDAHVVMNLIEQEQHVTFDVVRDTKMGRVLKMITESTYKSDRFSVQSRALDLLKQYIRLPRAHPSSNEPEQELVDQPEDDVINTDTPNAHVTHSNSSPPAAHRYGIPSESITQSVLVDPTNAKQETSTASVEESTVYDLRVA
ncbi:kinesin-domain-containing protein [Hesseltinella vesiculosa]|uniref:Kinesin-like protein n=1 Tax=Hesseltinella vesiculosa TaxID=101127 RepID=A0A1X2GXC2_9FUNG|nr:kinesin-domain-containing protein [Hesseltinella vesiculosa]